MLEDESTVRLNSCINRSKITQIIYETLIDKKRKTL